VFAAIRAVDYHLPEPVLTNEDLARDFPTWSAGKVAEKTGIIHRHLAAPAECASDLALAAACKLLAGGACRPDEVDFLLLCTQSPDYFLPTTACILQDRLALPTTAGALDFNLGCSGYVYGLGLAKGLIETGQATTVLLLTAETYSKFLDPNDHSVRALFGDAAAATLIRGRPDSPQGGQPWIGPFVFGTDGAGAENLIVHGGALRHRANAKNQPTGDSTNSSRDPDYLYMNGPEIFSFTLDAVPRAVQALLARTGITIEGVDRFVFHQANAYMLEHLRAKLRIPEEKFIISLSHCGNTVCSTIPIALKEAAGRGRLPPGSLVMLVGFGVGYSWGATFIRWSA
jgi:3-oxoacyl-[acyl-carrier-protein] synthase-3